MATVQTKNSAPETFDAKSAQFPFVAAKVGPAQTGAPAETGQPSNHMIPVVLGLIVLAAFLLLLWKAVGLGAIATIGFLGICFYVSLYCYFIWRTSWEQEH